MSDSDSNHTRSDHPFGPHTVPDADVILSEKPYLSTFYAHAANLPSIAAASLRALDRGEPQPDLREIVQFSQDRQNLHEIIAELLVTKKLGTAEISRETHLQELTQKIYEQIEGKNITPTQIPDIVKDYTHDIEDLTTRQNPARTTVFIAGGPASGKSSVSTMIAKLNAMDHQDSIVINPDDVKALLLGVDQLPEQLKPFHAALTHEESSYLIRQVVERKLQEIISKGNAPDVLYDTVNANRDRIKLAEESLSDVKMIIVGCETESQLNRAFRRGLETGRFVPSEVIKSGAKSVSDMLPEYVRLSEEIHLYYTEEIPPKLSAIKDGKESALKIFDTQTFVAIVVKSNLNVNSTSSAVVSKDDLNADDGIPLYYRESLHPREIYPSHFKPAGAVEDAGSYP